MHIHIYNQNSFKLRVKKKLSYMQNYTKRLVSQNDKRYKTNSRTGPGTER